MKIMLFEGGAEGLVTEIPGEHPAAELGELLGGEVKPARLDERLTLVMLAEGEYYRPIRYVLHMLGRSLSSISGNCAVVAMTQDGQVVDMTDGDLERATSYVRPLGEERYI